MSVWRSIVACSFLLGALVALPNAAAAQDSHGARTTTAQRQQIKPKPPCYAQDRKQRSGVGAWLGIAARCWNSARERLGGGRQN
ncbi:MAG TPA: hypothetical protein VF702_10120 [Allosphingosinicella sp.]|jgi:hypothetical protein